MGQRPPDIAAAAKPPDLDADGKPVTAPDNPHMTQPSADPSSIRSLGMKAFTSTVPAGIEGFATNPNIPKAFASAGRVIGGAAPVVGGMIEGGKFGGVGGAVGGGMLGVGGVAKGAWAGGGAGWHTGKLAQAMARPVAAVTDAVAPFLSMATAAQGGLDLAQMDDPKRRDIGFLGIGRTDTRTPAERAAAGDALADENRRAVALSDAKKRESAQNIMRYIQSLMTMGEPGR